MKSRNLIGLCLCISLLSAQAMAETKKKKQFLPDTAVRHKMNTISGTIRNLGPYIASEQEFIKDNNKKVIEKNLQDLSELFKNLKVHPVISTQGLSLNQMVMTEQLQQTVTYFKGGKRSLARAKFTSALNLCIGCHAQSPGQELYKIFPDKDIDKMKISLFEKAELYFITRDYDKAMALYDQFLSKVKKLTTTNLSTKRWSANLFITCESKKILPVERPSLINI